MPAISDIEERHLYAFHPWKVGNTRFEREVGMDFMRLSSDGWTGSHDYRKLLDFCTISLWAFVFARSYKRTLNAMEHEIWHHSSPLSGSSPDKVYMMAHAWFDDTGQFHWKMKQNGVCGRPRTQRSIKKTWNLLTAQAEGFDYDSIVKTSPQHICRAWQGMAGIYDSLIPHLIQDESKLPRHYHLLGQRSFLPWISRQMHNRGCDYMLDAYMSGIDLDDIALQPLSK